MVTEALTERERQIAEAYASGDSYRIIAERFCISPATVRTHVATVYRKLGVSCKLELFRALTDKEAEGALVRDEQVLISELALELEDVLRRERAIGEVLRIISRTHGDLGAVIEAVLDYTLELCDAEFGILFEYSKCNGFRAIFTRGIPPAFQEWLESQAAFSVGAGTGLGRLEARRLTINIPDVRSESIYKQGDPLRIATADLGGARSFAAIPMIAKDRLIGAFTIYRQSLRPFDNKALEIAQIFSDQSVIAIENARLLNRLSSSGESDDYDPNAQHQDAG